MEKIKDKDNLNNSESTNQIINNIKDKITKIDEINRKNDSESDEIENNEDEEKEQTRKIKRKERNLKYGNFIILMKSQINIY